MGDDRTAALLDAVRSAASQGRQLTLVGAGSKAPQPGEALPTLLASEHRGVLDYRPEELVLTARGGTPLEEVRALLGQRRQQLPFEPPMIRGKGTLGGAVAAGWSGPGRPWRLSRLHI